MKKKFKIVSLGCRTNQYEAQGYRDQLLQLGYREGNEDVEVCVVNSCTVTAAADKESRYQVRKLAKAHPEAKIFVTGCASDKDVAGFTKLPGVERVERNESKERLLANHFNLENFPEFSIRSFEGHTRAFVKVQDGCNSYCSYCIIPFVRGRSRSKDISSVIKEVETLIENGYKEVVLTGINIGDFDGGDGSKNLTELVREVDQVDGLKRLRISSIDPDEVDDQLLDAVINGKTTSPSMHIVLQSGSNVILKRMRRKYSKQMFLDTIDRLRAADPDFTFTTDVIVGFPGETEVDHQETLDLIDRVGFVKVHMFPFSVREKTRAARMPDPVDKETIKRRKSELLAHAEKRGEEMMRGFIGREMTVLMESAGVGHTDNFLPVKIDWELDQNEIYPVKLVDFEEGYLVGEVICS